MKSGSRMDPLPPAERKNTFGLPARPSFEFEKGDVEMHTLLSPESEDEPGKHAFYFTGP